MNSHRRVVNADNAPTALARYSHAVAAGGLLFCSGQVPLDPATGELVAGGLGDQTRRCLLNLAAVADAAGAALEDAVKVTIFTTQLDRFAEINTVYEEFFPAEAPPARAAVGVTALPGGAELEIEAVVALPS